MQIEAAQSLVLAALAVHYPATPAVLETLNAGRPGHPSFVFRAQMAADHFVVAKLTQPALLAAYANRLMAVHPGMAQGPYRVPEPLFYDAGLGLLLMEDTWGQRGDVLLVKDADAAARVLDKAGAWIARFHRLTRFQAAFNPDPHVNWIRKAIAGHKSGLRPIPDCEGLRALLPDLDALAEDARGGMVSRAITHRDFHLRNLLIRKQGRSYGIDFENAGRDECIRDLLFFLADCAKVQTATPTQASLRATAQALRQSYGQPLGDAAVRRFFQVAFAMAAWAGLEDGTPPGPKRRRTIEVIQMLTQADDLFADP